jgi:hypothetical protein
LAAFFALYLHEDFHHKLEAFGIRLALADRTTPDHFLRYDAEVYRPSFNTDDNLEEALAGADTYQRLDTEPYRGILGSDIRVALKRWLSWRFSYLDPPGYRMAKCYLTDQPFKEASHRLQNQVLKATLCPKSDPRHWQAGPNMLRSLFPITADIYLLVPIGSTINLPVSAKPYVVSVRQTRQWLRINGFVKLADRGKGDHERYERADGTAVGLDGRARDLSRTVENAIAKTLGLSQHELRAAVNQGHRL